MQRMCLFSGTANPDLAEKIAEYLMVQVGNASVRRFSDGEIFVQINENVRGRDVFVIQPVSAPANDHLMELLIMVDALRRASAGRITTVIPYYGYARQDRKEAGRTPISAKLVADLLHAAGVQRVLTMDLHSGQIQGFFNMPVDNIFATPVLLGAIRERGVENALVVSPDVGGVVRARSYAKRLNLELAIIDKRRPAPNIAEIHHIIGDVVGKECLIVDDMVDTAGTLTKAANALIEHGAKSVVSVCTHAVLSGPAVDRIEESQLTGLLVTDTIKLSPRAAACQKIKVATVSNLLGEAIRRISDEESVSSLFV
ncbi:MAG: ribose-phosphate pyrophosphokinase [Magnetococcales bacterium]|nr:ribose-phosphate pyrophosphokinase [Magnetococcales bacterium]MBF0321965.1 ribose-phosphate pyrophosphokinase [Magnetococcales bacterium]